MSMPAIETPERSAETQRDRFYRIVTDLLGEEESLALVLAEVGFGYLATDLSPQVRERIVNVGIREQLAIATAAGLALAGLRPIVHTFPPFLVERPFEQVKLDLGHQGLGAVLVSAQGSYGWPEGGETHFGPRDVALVDTLDEWTIQVPGHADEAEAMLREAVVGTGRCYLRLDAESNREAYDVSSRKLLRLQQGPRGLIVAVGPTLDRVLSATAGLDVSVAYATTVRPLDTEGLRELADRDVVIVEPYLEGTSAHLVSSVLADRPHRLLSMGVQRTEQRHYGTIADHHRLHGLDVAGLRERITRFLGPAS